MERPSPEGENIIKDVRNLSILKKEINNVASKDIRNLFRPEKEKKAIKEIIIRDIRNTFECKEENYYKPVRAGNFRSNNYIEYESKGTSTKTVSVAEYLNKIKPCLKYIITGLKQSNTGHCTFPRENARLVTFTEEILN